MIEATNDSAGDDAEDMLGQLDYRDVVAILLKHYPSMDAQEIVRLVLEQLDHQTPGNCTALLAPAQN